jgi:uncharacterized protein YbaP (TraB family)
LQRALDAIGTIALELDPLDADNVAQMQTALNRSTKRTVSPDTRRRLVQQTNQQCLALSAADESPSELVLAELGLAIARREGLEAQFGSEVFLALTARQRGLSVVSLESVALQMGALLAANDAEAQQMLDDGLAELESGRAREHLLDLITMWETGDFQRLDTYEQWCDCVVTEMEKLQMQRLLDDRNPGMARRIDGLHRSGQRVLAAVGSLHMAGPRGLPALLARMGYVVERLP